MSQKRLAKNISAMSIAVFFSRILGLIRDQVMAFYFGTTYLNDAFNVAYNLPNLLRRLFGEGALSSAFVPIYNEIGIKKGKQEQIQFALNILSVLILFLTVLTFIGIAFAPLIVKILYPGLPSKTSIIAIKLSRIMFPYLFFIGLSSTFIAILNSHDYFFMTGLSSALLNIGMITTILLPALLSELSNQDLIVWAGWGVFFGGFLQTIVNLPYLKRIGYKFKIVLKFTGEAITTLWKRFIPAMIGIGIREINLVADALMASFLPIGSITALNMGNRLMQLPLGIFGIATGTAILPHYSKNVTEKNWSELTESLKFATISLAALMLPITVIICALGADFVMILFQRGVFNQHAALMTTQALFFYSLGLVFYSLNQTITPLFYANKDTKTPVKIAAYMVGLNILLNFILMQFIQHRGLALSTSITALVNYIILIILIRKALPEVSYASIPNQLLKILLINLFLCFFLIMSRRMFSVSNIWILLGVDAILSCIYFLVVFIFYLIFKVAYTQEIKRNICSKFLRKS
ncbi:MAG: murein biosynthesis integral membrane protein MurJ [Candidatus Cloacimonadaceae bacterium]